MSQGAPGGGRSPTRPTRLRRAALRLGLPVLLAVYAVHAAWLRCFVEDGYIALRFARNLAGGHGLVWNPGEAPVEGFTNFLLVVLSAAAMRAGLDGPAFSQALGVAAGALALPVSWVFARRILGCGPGVALVPPLLLAASGPFACWSASGMETNLFALFVLTACFFWADGLSRRAAASPWLAAVFLWLATLTRPEGLLLAAVLAGVGPALARGRTRASLAGPLALYAVLFLAYFAWRYAYFGYAVPNTFYAKTGGSLHQHWRGAVYTAFFAAYFLLPLVPGLAAAALRRPPPRPTREDTGVWVCAPVCLVYAIYVVYVGGDYLAMFRFYVPLLPLVYLLYAAALRGALEPASASPTRRAWAGAALAIAVAGTAVHSTPLEARLFPQIPQNHGTWRGVQLERAQVARLTLIARHFDAAKRSPNDSVATGAIGAIGYFADLRVYDLHGIVDPVIAHREIDPKELGRGLPGHERWSPATALARAPTFFMWHRLLFPRREGPPPERRPRFPAAAQRLLDAHYVERSVWLEDTYNRDRGYFTYFERVGPEARPGRARERPPRAAAAR